MARDAVIEAARSFHANGKLPRGTYRRGELSVHPDHEMVMERLFNPYGLGRELRQHGFDCRVRGHWAGASGRRLHRVTDRALGFFGPLAMPSARGFRIAAYRH